MISSKPKIEGSKDIEELLFLAHTEPDALGELYAVYYDRIFRFCLHRLFNTEVAEDVTSQVFIAVAQKIRNFRGQTDSEFRNWIYTIAANKANTYIRKASRRKKLIHEAARSMKHENADTGESKANITWPMIYSVLSKLNPQHQTIVTLRYFENMDFDQIAEIINLKPGAVRVKLHRILKKLKCHLRTMADGQV